MKIMNTLNIYQFFLNKCINFRAQSRPGHHSGPSQEPLCLPPQLFQSKLGNKHKLYQYLLF